ncbi:Hypothetical protein Minf_1416 [Methylacidiphilum infernorum V4]|uniref:Uncharacterized protein n=1 Tax=Methylacidiphilum infernorum (isolate V4) TaxID=481448 RepID=B3DVW7_METI4|nr:Hypothetical protein Minf_1416 [Methylacidiphilum infernorum V4]
MKKTKNERLRALEKITSAAFYPLSFMSKIHRLALHLCCIIVLLCKRKMQAVFYHVRGIVRLFSQEK